MKSGLVFDPAGFFIFEILTEMPEIVPQFQSSQLSISGNQVSDLS